MASTKIRVIPRDSSGDRYLEPSELADGWYTTTAKRDYLFGPFTLDEYNAYADESQDDYERPENEDDLTVLIVEGREAKAFPAHWDSDGHPIWYVIEPGDLRPACRRCQGTGKLGQTSTGDVTCRQCHGTGKRPYDKAVCAVRQDPMELRALFGGRVTLPAGTEIVSMHANVETQSFFVVVDGPGIPETEPGVQLPHFLRTQETIDGELHITFTDLLR